MAYMVDGLKSSPGGGTGGVRAIKVTRSKAVIKTKNIFNEDAANNGNCMV